MPDQPLLGKVAIVTGAGRLRGIGRATAVALAELGADVVVTGTGRDPKSFPPDEQSAGWRDIESTAEQVRASGRRCLPLVVDVSDSASVQGMVDRTVTELGRIDILVNNAAHARGSDRVPVLQMDEQLFRRVLEVKVVGAFLCTRTAGPVMIKQGQGGRIVNISSGAAPSGMINASAYSGANAALEGMTRTWAREFARHNILVNAVRPGIVDTHRMDDLGRGDRWAAAQANIPLGRASTDEEVGEFIAFLCTDVTARVTGQCLNIGGGSVMS